MATTRWLVTISALVSAVLGICPQNYTHGTSCYIFGEEPVTWTDAEELCEVYQARLAIVESQQENEFLKGVIRSKYPSYQGGVWLGATDIFSEGKWEWILNKGNLNTFSDWAPSEPNNGLGREDCLNMYSSLMWSWNDSSCDETFYFICEQEVTD